MPIGILGIGAYLPDEIVDNARISAWTGMAAGEIERRTGISERRYAAEGEPTSRLALAAVRDLAVRYPDALEGVTTLLVGTSTPDQPQPSTAAIVQGALGLPSVLAADVNAVCAGAVVGMVMGEALAEKAAHDGRVLVVGADRYSGIMEHTDWRTVSLFGDGAGAVVLGPVPDRYGIHARRVVTHGEHSRLVEVRGGGTRAPLDARAIEAGEDRFRMEGRRVREYVEAILPDLIRGVIADAGFQVSDIDRFMLHQANPRLLEGLARELAVSYDRVPISADRYGNTGAASVLVTLADANERRPLQRGERIVFAAVGGGMSAGALVMTWH